MNKIKSVIAFTELLSLGISTIGVRDTLSAVFGQLIDDITQALRHQCQPASRVA
jgi:hypothetical protein